MADLRTSGGHVVQFDRRVLLQSQDCQRRRGAALLSAVFPLLVTWMAGCLHGAHLPQRIKVLCLGQKQNNIGVEVLLLLDVLRYLLEV